MGTTALGAIILTFLSPFKWLGKLKAALATILGLGNCCDYELLDSPISKDAWSDVCLQGDSFLRSASHARWVVEHESSASGILSGACNIFIVIGVGSVALLGALLAY